MQVFKSDRIAFHYEAGFWVVKWEGKEIGNTATVWENGVRRNTETLKTLCEWLGEETVEVYNAYQASLPVKKSLTKAEQRKLWYQQVKGYR